MIKKNKKKKKKRKKKNGNLLDQNRQITDIER